MVYHILIMVIHMISLKFCICYWNVENIWWTKSESRIIMKKDGNEEKAIKYKRRKENISEDGWKKYWLVELWTELQNHSLGLWCMRLSWEKCNIAVLVLLMDTSLENNVISVKNEEKTERNCKRVNRRERRNNNNKTYEQRNRKRQHLKNINRKRIEK